MKYLILLLILLVIYRFWIAPGLKKAAHRESEARVNQAKNGHVRKEKPKVGEYIDYEEVKKE